MLSWREEFLKSGWERLGGASGVQSQEKEVKRLVQQLMERVQIIGELTVANRNAFHNIHYLTFVVRLRFFTDKIK